ncbi:MAG: TfoX/Sxy family protein [Chloroflexota bacterium]|nr:TfoX/Sxy family protein [Chloroflexota bacterium]
METEEAKDNVVRGLAPLPVSVRTMFGGYGLFLEDRFFGVISDGRVYFRTDATSRADYLGRGMTAFQPRNRRRGPKTVDRNFEVPDDVLADANLLRDWALRAASASS